MLDKILNKQILIFKRKLENDEKSDYCQKCNFLKQLILIESFDFIKYTII
jgi:hypothetical protein